MAEVRESRAKDALVLGALAVLALALFSPGLLGHLPTQRDMPGITLPSRAFWRSAVLAGELPVWNPLVGLGIPTLAVPIHGALYVGHLPLLIGSFAVGVALTWALHTWIASAGGYALARAVGVRPEAAAIAGLVFGFGGYAVSMAWNGEKTLPYAWIPWMAWGIYRAASSPTPGRLIVAALPPALVCAAGDPFLLFDGVLLALPFAFAGTAAGAPPRKVARDVATSLGVPLLLAFLFAAPVVLPALALRSATDRPGALSLDLAEAWSLHPVRWLELFVSRPFGNPLGPPDDYAGKVYADDLTTQAIPWAVSLYLGAATVALATSARGRIAKYLSAMAFVALLLALGRHTPFDAWARVLFPPLAMARYPEKHVAVVCDALAVLAALGAERLFARDGARSQTTKAAAVAVAGLVVALVLAPTPLRQVVDAGLVRSVLAVALVFGAIAAAQKWPRALGLPALVLAADLFSAARPLLAWTPEAGVPPSPLAASVLEGKTNVPPRIFRWKPPELREIALLPGNAASLYGIAAVPGVDSALTPGLGPLVASLAGSGPRTWELLRVSHLIAPVPSPPSSSPFDAWRVVAGPPRPRAWMVGRVEVAEDDAATDARLAEGAFDVEAESMLPRSTRDEGAALLLGAPARAMGACDVVTYGFGRVDLACDAKAPALVVLGDGFSEGWGARVDGESRGALRVDAVLRGVSVGAGKHAVSFVYEAPRLAVGALIAVLGGLIALLALMRERGR